MTYLQVSLAEDDNQASGRELRDGANYSDMSHFSSVSRIFLKRKVTTSKKSGVAATVAVLEEDGLQAILYIIRDIKPRAVLFESVTLLQAVEVVRLAEPRLPLIVDFHNVESRLYREMRLARWPRVLRPLAAFASQRRIRQAITADLRVAACATSLWVCSEADRRLVQSMGIDRPVFVVANPIPAWSLAASGDSGAEDGDVLFVGHLGYAPNKLAVRELALDIMPRLRRIVPEARLHVCGRAPGRKLQRLLNACGGRLTPNPPDLAPAYARASVTAVPLQQGGGTRLKVLEALAVGCPVVATAKAVEGLDLVPGRHYLRAETPEEFATMLAQVLSDASLRARLREAGRAFVLANFDKEGRREAVRLALAGIEEAG